MFKNTASQKIAIFAFDTTTGASKTGDAANITVYVNKDWAGVNALGDTSATEIDSTNAKGWYLFDLTQGETNADALLFSGKSSTSNISVVGQLMFTTPPNFPLLSIDGNGRTDVTKIGGTSQTAGDVFARLGAPAGASMSADIAIVASYIDTEVAAIYSRVGVPAGASIAADIATVAGYIDTEVGAIKTKTDQLTFTVTNQVDVNVVDWKGATAPAMSGDAFNRLGASVGVTVSADIATIATYVDTEVAAIKAKTDQLTFSTANRVDSQIFGMENNTVTNAAIATDAIGSAELAATAITEIQTGLSTLDAAGIRTAVGLASANLDTQLSTFSPPTANQNADALLDRASGVEASWTVREALRVILGVLAGPTSGMSTTSVILKNPGDSKNRVSATVDASGNRSSVTYDKS